MKWINDTQNAINFIESNLLENINADDVSKYIKLVNRLFSKNVPYCDGTFHKRIYKKQTVDACGRGIKKYASKSNRCFLEVRVRFTGQFHQGIYAVSRCYPHSREGSK